MRCLVSLGLLFVFACSTQDGPATPDGAQAVAHDAIDAASPPGYGGADGAGPPVTDTALPSSDTPSATPVDGGTSGIPDSWKPVGSDTAEGDAGTTPVPPPGCGYGTIAGIVCSPSEQVFVNGASVSIDTVDCDGEPLHLLAISDADGKYLLTGVPSGLQKVHVSSGSYTNDYSVEVEAGKTTDISALGYKACPQAFDKCATGAVKGNVCKPAELGPNGQGIKVSVETTDCNGDPVTVQTYTGYDGSFLVSGVPVGTQVVRIATGGIIALETVVIEPNKASDLGFLGKADCKEEEKPPCTVENGCKEACDCIDNDGDGETDEGCGFFWSLTCIDNCNCIDDDKDGVVDEDCTDPLDCGAELCDCIDNDGDGKVDESCCNPGDVRFCDENIYCAWGKQTCKADGSWGECKEIPLNDIPKDCQPYYDFDQEPVIYDKICCQNAGFCCQDYPEWESVGTCSTSTCQQ